MAQTTSLHGAVRRAADYARHLAAFRDGLTMHDMVPCLHKSFQARVKETPLAIALIHGSDTTSYHALNSAANLLARELLVAGVRPSQPVLLCADKGVKAVIAILAILKAGGAYVPISPHEAPARAQQLLRRLRPELCVVADVEPSWIHGLKSLHKIVPAQIQAGSDQEDICVDVSSGGLAVVLHTSGSTGQPKGVMLTHRAIATRLSPDRYARTSTSYQRASLGVVAHLSDLIWPLMSGASVLIPEDSGAGTLGYAFMQALKCGRVTFLSTVPSHLRELLADDEVVAAMSGLRHLIVSGEPLTAKLVRACYNRLPSALVTNSYGMTETVGAVATATVSDEDPTATDFQPLENIAIRILDRGMRSVIPGEVGEICVAGAQMAAGYLDEPELTAARFIEHPLEGRLYRTGDFARLLPDGRFRLIGRTDAQVKVYGFRVELQDVEHCIETLEGVQVAVVVQTTSADNYTELCAFVVPSPHTTVSEELLREHVRNGLPLYMRPHRWFISAGLLLGATGKIDRSGLRKKAQELTRTRPTPPGSTGLSEGIARAWEDVLGVKPQDTPHFFDANGDSLAALRLTWQVQSAWGAVIQVSDVFDCPNVHDLVEVAQARFEALRSSAAASVTDEWSGIASAYSGYTSPLRPSAADISCYESALTESLAHLPCASPAVLMLGVTPDLATMLRRTTTQVTAADSSLSMIEALWSPGDGKAICADWRQLPLADCSCDAVIGDGVLNVVSYPDGLLSCATEVHRVLRPGGVFISRCFVPAVVPQHPDAILESMRLGRFDEFGQFEFMLLMAMQSSVRVGTEVRRFASEWARTGEVDRCLARSPTPWRQRGSMLVQQWRESAMTCWFPTVSEIAVVVAGLFLIDVDTTASAASGGDRCPVLVFKRSGV